MRTIEKRVRLLLGRVLATPGALAVLDNQSQALELLQRHASGDWGEVDADDSRANDDALRSGARVLSVYTVNGVRLWVITESDRACTTILLPEEY